MAKTLPASTTPVIETMSVSTDPGTGDVDGITVTVNVTYGSLHSREDFDLWATMNIGEKTAFQASVWDRLTTEITAVYS